MTRHDTGILIAVEGIDGAGKTTQVRLLADALSEAGHVVVCSKEPTDGPWGQRIRQSAANGRMGLGDEIRAFVEDRKQHVRELILPSLSEGKTVILDRYFYSTIAYQGARGGNIEQLTREMLAIAPCPDVVILLDVSPEIGLRRISQGRGEVPNEFEKLENLRDVREVFLTLAQNHDNIVKIDATQGIDAVRRQVLDVVSDAAVKSKRRPDHGVPHRDK